MNLEHKITQVENARAALAHDGYTVMEGVLTADQVARVRSACTRLYRENLGPGHGEIYPSAVLQTREIAEVIFGASTIAALASLLGGAFDVFPSFHVKGNTYVGWHTDHAFRELSRTQPQVAFLQCAVYMQPAEPWGGLDVLPRTHHGPLAVEHFPNLTRKAPEVDAASLPQSHSINHRPGDLVVWDARLGHRSSPRCPNDAESPKFGVHWTVGRGPENDAQRIMERLRGRTSNYVDGKLVDNARFADMKTLVYPDSYPDFVRDAVQSHQLRVLS